MKGQKTTWIRPTTLQELLELKEKYPTAKLVVGNTELGGFLSEGQSICLLSSFSRIINSAIFGKCSTSAYKW